MARALHSLQSQRDVAVLSSPLRHLRTDPVMRRFWPVDESAAFVARRVPCPLGPLTACPGT
jgi:hypothetical protein